MRSDRGRPALLALGLLAGSAGCSRTDCSFTIHPARTEAPAPALLPPVVRALHFADFGEVSAQQAAVAAGMAASHARRPFDLALVAGDNLYECGPDAARPGAGGCAFGPGGATVVPGFDPPADDRFARQHERPLAALGSLPVHLALGNHDVATWSGGSSSSGSTTDTPSRAFSSPTRTGRRSASRRRWDAGRPVVSALRPKAASSAT